MKRPGFRPDYLFQASDTGPIVGEPSTTAKSNMYDNAPQETRYIYTDFDSIGQRLNGSHHGSHHYTVTFAKSQLPPVNGFWSLTLYKGTSLRGQRAESLLARHQEQIAEVQSRRLADALLSASIAGSGQGNQLVPAPEDEFSLYIRALLA